MPRRKRSTFGTIEKRGRDHWTIKWWETRDGVHRRRSRVVWGTRREAERELAKIRAGLDETDRGSQLLAARVTVGEAYERWWLPDAEQRLQDGRLAKKTFAQLGSTWRLRVSRWAEVPCSAVRPLDIQQWLDPMTKKPASDALALLRQILDFATTYEVVRENVARRPYRMPQGHTVRTDGAYTLAELDQIADAARGAVTEAALILGMFASCRTGESLGPMLQECSLVESHGLQLVVVDIVRQVKSDASLSADGQLKTGRACARSWSRRRGRIVSGSLSARSGRPGIPG